MELKCLIFVQYQCKAQMLGEVKMLLSSKRVTHVVQFSNEGKISSLCYLPLPEALFAVSLL